MAQKGQQPICQSCQPLACASCELRTCASVPWTPFGGWQLAAQACTRLAPKSGVRLVPFRGRTREVGLLVAGWWHCAVWRQPFVLHKHRPNCNARVGTDWPRGTKKRLATDVPSISLFRAGCGATLRVVISWLTAPKAAAPLLCEARRRQCSPPPLMTTIAPSEPPY